MQKNHLRPFTPFAANGSFEPFSDMQTNRREASEFADAETCAVHRADLMLRCGFDRWSFVHFAAS
jgi:hypothetical protein